MPVQQAGDRRDGSGDEEPELHVQRDHVGAAHRVERRGVEDRLQRRVGRVRSRREDVLVEAVEEVDREALRHPERPGVVLLEALQARDPEEGLEEEAGERDADGRDEQDRRGPGPAEAVRRRPTPRSSPVPTPAAPRATSDTESSIPPKGTPTTRSAVQTTPNAATPSR